jgi:ribosomal protein L35
MAKKLKTKQTLKKRIKITKNGKLIRGQIRTGHLKVKWSANKKHRKNKPETQDNKGHIKKFKKMLGKHA